MLYLLLLEKLLLDADTQSKATYLFHLFVLCASEEFQVSDFALSILKKHKSPELFSTYLNSIVSRLMRRFRQVELYPTSGSIMAVLVNQDRLSACKLTKVFLLIFYSVKKSRKSAINLNDFTRTNTVVTLHFFR